MRSRLLMIVSAAALVALLFTLTGCEELFGPPDRPSKPKPRPVDPPPEPNRAPTADAGADQTVTEGAMVTLAGSGTDPDGDALTYFWAIGDGGYAGMTPLTDHDTSMALWSASIPDGMIAIEVQFSLRVTDPGGLSDTDYVIVTVEAEPEPQPPQVVAIGLPQREVYASDAHGPSALNVTVRNMDPETCYFEMGWEAPWCDWYDPNGITHYRHKIIVMPQAVYDNSDWHPRRGALPEACSNRSNRTGYGEERPVSAPVTDSLSPYPDAHLILCIMAKETSGEWQTAGFPFEKDTCYGYVPGYNPELPGHPHGPRGPGSPPSPHPIHETVGEGSTPTTTLLERVVFIEGGAARPGAIANPVNVYRAYFRDGTNVQIEVKVGDFARQFEMEAVNLTADRYGTLPEILREGGEGRDLDAVELVRCYVHDIDGPDCAAQANSDYDTFGAMYYNRYDDVGRILLRRIAINIRGLTEDGSVHPPVEFGDGFGTSFEGFALSGEISRGLLVHEFTHLLDDRMGELSYTSEWRAAAKADGTYVNSYAATNAAEDFAETFGTYLGVRYDLPSGARPMCPISLDFEKYIPNRFRYLDTRINFDGRMCPVVATDCTE